MRIIAAITLLWAGMVLGISFLETPVKFTAPSVTLAIGLDVGRHVFAALHKVELLWSGILGVMIQRVRPARAMLLPLLLAIFVLILQVVWLRPLLDARVSIILAGGTPSPSPWHMVYMGSELVKLIALIGGAISALKGLAPMPSEVLIPPVVPSESTRSKS